jgi:hypothetical protein
MVLDVDIYTHMMQVAMYKPSNKPLHIFLWFLVLIYTHIWCRSPCINLPLQKLVYTLRLLIMVTWTLTVSGSCMNLSEQFWYIICCMLRLLIMVTLTLTVYVSCFIVFFEFPWFDRYLIACACQAQVVDYGHVDTHCEWILYECFSRLLGLIDMLFLAHVKLRLFIMVTWTLTVYMSFFSLFRDCLVW